MLSVLASMIMLRGVAGSQQPQYPLMWKAFRKKVQSKTAVEKKLTDLPKAADLRPKFGEFDLPVCKQDGPWCWDFTMLGVLEYEAAAELGQKCPLSPGYLAWAAQETDTQGTGGSNFGRANRGLENYGIVPLIMGGIPPSEGTVPQPEQKLVNLGKVFGEIDFHWIRFWSREPLSADQMKAIKTDIASGHPVAVGMQWPNRTTFVPDTTMMRVPPKRQIFDGHCVILVGYQDDAATPGGGSFLFRNSWGSDWADSGYARMPYALLGFCINDAFSIRKITPYQDRKPGKVESFSAVGLASTDVTGGTLTKQDMGPFGKAWNGKNQMAFKTDKVGAGFSVVVPVAQAGTYDVQLIITRAENYGGFSVTFPDGHRSATLDASGPGVSRSHPISIGTVRLRKGPQTFRFTIEGPSSASSGLGLGLGLVAIQLRRN